MAWEHRGAQTYYYRSVKRGGRVTKIYFGTGPLVALTAAMDAEQQAERQAKTQAWQQARADMEALDAQITDWWDNSSILVNAWLLAHGYYRHKRGPWRKRAVPPRHTVSHDQGEQGQ